jgi:hypothetical protein
MPHRIYNELDRLAAISRRRRLKAEELQRLDELVKETRAIIVTDDSKMLRRIFTSARSSSGKANTLRQDSFAEVRAAASGRSALRSRRRHRRQLRTGPGAA